MIFFVTKYHSQVHKMKSIHAFSGNIGKSFRSKKFSPFEDIQLYRSHIHISEDPIQGIYQTRPHFCKGWPIILIHWRSIITREFQSPCSLDGDQYKESAVYIMDII